MNELYAGLLRHALTAVGGYFVAKGDIGAGDVDAIAGAVAAIFGVGWSMYAKKKAAPAA